MKPHDLIELGVLAALWGASFLFMRLGAGEFGPVTLAGVRVLGASLFLVPLLLAKGQWPALRTHWRVIGVVGLTNSALPFLAFSFAALGITAGLSAIFNATTPLWSALIAWLWLGERLDRSRTVGLAIGFAGVLWLAWDKAGLRPGAGSDLHTGAAVLACIAATFAYGWSANATRRWLTGVPPLALAAGSQCSALLWLALPAWWSRPAQSPSATAWVAAALLAVACTGVAYVLYFRLLARLGPSKAVTVTFLIPAFAVLWGALFLGEAVTPPMLLGGAVILLGTGLAVGVVTLPGRWRAPAS
jgi:drug/metabolite transporter (DMT)-like permease